MELAEWPCSFHAASSSPASLSVGVLSHGVQSSTQEDFVRFVRFSSRIWPF